MTAYAIFIRERLRDPETIKKYYEKLPHSFDGRDVVRRANQATPLVLEGPAIESVVVLEFPTIEAAQDWYHSDAYSEARRYRNLSADYRAFIVEGL
ncbi:DUF1330 domain-containing protein [Caulobacter sp. 602-1]|uniref:DUF1330 domain-containing protein n=1 Tax=Caulobacter sp. 602-1 TaxID=2492472 RepID=UPI0013156CBA|nr:DUF1330 domain-containing protein [Caulobacter sp. 602-1]